MPLRGSWELKRAPIRSYKKLPRLRHPAGYVCLIRDMDYGNRYKLEPTNDPAAHLDDVRAALPFKTKIAYIAKTNDAEAAEHYLHRRYARRSARDEWFDLDDAQLREIHSLTAPGQHDAADWQRERTFDLEEPSPAAHSLERPPPVSLKDLISNSCQTAAPSRRSQAAEEKAAGWNRGWLYFFIGVIVLAVLAAALGARLAASRLSDSPANQTNTIRNTRSSASRSSPRPTATRVTLTPYYVTAPANVRACPRTSCTVRATLNAGVRIQSSGRVQGQRIGGNDYWIQFQYNGKPAYIYSGLVSSARPAASPTRRPTSTKRPPATPTLMPTAADTDIPTATDTPTSTHTPTLTAQPTAAAAAGATMYVTTRGNMSARVRACPGTACGIIGGLNPGANIQALGRVKGEAVNGNSEWIEFRHGGEAAYIHGSLVSTKRPNQ